MTTTVTKSRKPPQHHSTTRSCRCCCVGGGSTRCWLLTLLSIDLLTILVRQTFDFLGRLWLPIVLNFAHLLLLIFAFFGAGQLRPNFLVAFLLWCPLWSAWNLLICCFYFNLGLLDRDRLDLFGFGTNGRSWFYGRTFCDKAYNSTLHQNVITSCAFPYWYLEVGQSTVQLLLLLLCAALTIAFLLLFRQQRKFRYKNGGPGTTGYSLRSSGESIRRRDQPRVTVELSDKKIITPNFYSGNPDEQHGGSSLDTTGYLNASFESKNSRSNNNNGYLPHNNNGIVRNYSRRSKQQQQKGDHRLAWSQQQDDDDDQQRQKRSVYVRSQLTSSLDRSQVVKRGAKSNNADRRRSSDRILKDNKVRSTSSSRDQQQRRGRHGNNNKSDFDSSIGTLESHLAISPLPPPEFDNQQQLQHHSSISGSEATTVPVSSGGNGSPIVGNRLAANRNYLERSVEKLQANPHYYYHQNDNDVVDVNNTVVAKNNGVELSQQQQHYMRSNVGGGSGRRKPFKHALTQNASRMALASGRSKDDLAQDSSDDDNRPNCGGGRQHRPIVRPYALVDIGNSVPISTIATEFPSEPYRRGNVAGVGVVGSSSSTTPGTPPPVNSVVSFDPKSNNTLIRYHENTNRDSIAQLLIPPHDHHFQQQHVDNSNEEVFDDNGFDQLPPPFNSQFSYHQPLRHNGYYVDSTPTAAMTSSRHLQETVDVTNSSIPIRLGGGAIAGQMMMGAIVPPISNKAATDRTSYDSGVMSHSTNDNGTGGSMTALNYGGNFNNNGGYNHNSRMTTLSNEISNALKNNNNNYNHHNHHPPTGPYANPPDLIEGVTTATTSTPFNHDNHYFRDPMVYGSLRRGGGQQQKSPRPRHAPPPQPPQLPPSVDQTHHNFEGSTPSVGAVEPKSFAFADSMRDYYHKQQQQTPNSTGMVSMTSSTSSEPPQTRPSQRRSSQQFNVEQSLLV